MFALKVCKRGEEYCSTVEQNVCVVLQVRFFLYLEGDIVRCQ